MDAVSVPIDTLTDTEIVNAIVAKYDVGTRLWAAAVVFTASDYWLRSGWVRAERTSDGTLRAQVSWGHVAEALATPEDPSPQRFQLAIACNLAAAYLPRHFDMADLRTLPAPVAMRVLDALDALSREKQ